MGIFHNLVFTCVEFTNNKPVATTLAWAFSEDIYYSWTSGKDNPELIIENIQKAYEAIEGGGFLVKRGDESKLPKPFPAKPQVVSRRMNSKEGFSLEANHNFPTHDASSLYHYILPKYCYCVERGIKTNNENKPIILTYEERQTIAFIHSKDEFQLELPFIRTDEREFNKLKDRHPRTIILPPWVNNVYRELKDFAAKVVADYITFKHLTISFSSFMGRTRMYTESMSSTLRPCLLAVYMIGTQLEWFCSWFRPLIFLPSLQGSQAIVPRTFSYYRQAVCHLNRIYLVRMSLLPAAC